MKLLLLVLCSCIAAQHTTAQEKKADPYNYKIAVRVSPLALLDPVETNFSAGVEVRLKKNLSVGGDAAYFFASNVLADNRPMSGFYVRPTLRIYSGKKIKTFTEIVFMYKHTVRKEEDWLGMDCVNGVPSYEKFTEYKKVRDVFDLSFRGGVREQLFSSPNWLFEFYIGLGVRQKFHSIKYSEPNTCVVESFGEFFGVFDQSSTGHYTLITLPLGIRLVYVLK